MAWERVWQQRSKSDALFHVSPFIATTPIKLDSRRLAMGFIEVLLKSKRFDYFMVVVDRLSKFPHFITLKHPFTAKQMIEIFIDKVISKNWIQKSTITDQDKIFKQFSERVVFRYGDSFKKKYYLSPSNDRSDKVDKLLLRNISSLFFNERPTKWSKCIP